MVWDRVFAQKRGMGYHLVRLVHVYYHFFKPFLGDTHEKDTRLFERALIFVSERRMYEKGRTCFRKKY